MSINIYISIFNVFFCYRLRYTMSASNKPQPSLFQVPQYPPAPDIYISSHADSSSDRNKTSDLENVG